jgi:glycosyltransferase involved in cell wall biosynthesis
MRIGIAWECPWVPSSYGKLSLWLASELQRAGVDVRIYCPSTPEVQLYSTHTLYSPECLHRELGVCVELERPIEVYNTRWLCESGDDVDVYVLCGSPYGQVEASWISKCSKSDKPVAGYFVTESDVVPPFYAQWLLHVDAVGFTTKAVARAFLIHDSIREMHGDWILVPHGLPEYYFRLDPEAIVEYGLMQYEKRGIWGDPGLRLALESRESGVLYGTVAKDHPRKDFGALLSAFSSVKHTCEERGLPLCDKVRLFLGFVRAVGVPTWFIDMIVQALGLQRSDVLILEDASQESGITEFFLLFSYSLMSTFVFATMGEGWGMPLIEAGALSRPVVATRTPVTEEVWEGYPLLVKSRPVVVSEGFILHATDYSDLARKMSKLLSLRERRRYGTMAKRIVEKYTSRRMAESLLKLTDLAVQKRGTKKPHPLKEYKTDPSPGYRDLVLEVLELA